MAQSEKTHRGLVVWHVWHVWIRITLCIMHFCVAVWWLSTQLNSSFFPCFGVFLGSCHGLMGNPMLKTVPTGCGNCCFTGQLDLETWNVEFVKFHLRKHWESDKFNEITAPQIRLMENGWFNGWDFPWKKKQANVKIQESFFFFFARSLSTLQGYSLSFPDFPPTNPADFFQVPQPMRAASLRSLQHPPNSQRPPPSNSQSSWSSYIVCRFVGS